MLVGSDDVDDGVAYDTVVVAQNGRAARAVSRNSLCRRLRSIASRCRLCGIGLATGRSRRGCSARCRGRSARCRCRALCTRRCRAFCVRSARRGSLRTIRVGSVLT